MTRRLRRPGLARLAPRLVPWLALLGSLLCLAAPAAAGPKEAAGKRFMRGVSLYEEADYRAALVEFKRAYEIAPNPGVLYNIGQTYFQLQNYAAALATFERYLAESGPRAAHRAEVEQSIETLRSRVGKLEVKTNVPDVEITIDEEPVGQTPLDKPIVVSIGRRKIVATIEGQPPQSRTVEIAAGETARVSLAFGGATGAPVAGAADRERKPPGRGLVLAGWTATGVLAAGAITAGVLAFSASRDLDELRGAFPGDPAALDAKAGSVRTLSLTADLLGAAAVVAGGVTLYLTMSRSRARARDKELRVGVSPKGLQVSGSF